MSGVGEFRRGRRAVGGGIAMARAVRRTGALLAASVAVGLVGSMLTGGYAAAAGPEQVRNGGFDAGTAGWTWYGTTSTGIADGALCSVVPGGLANF
jgi:endoglucanase